MLVEVINSESASFGTVDIPVSSDVGDVSDYAVSLINRVRLFNSAVGTKKTKGVSEVRGHSAKPYRQKGTGRARHGSTKAPQFRGGGMAHAIKPKLRRLSLNKKFKSSMLRGLLLHYLENGKVKFVDLGLSVRFLRSLVSSSKSAIVVHQKSVDRVLPLRNLEKLSILGFGNLSCFDILDYDVLYFDFELKDDLMKMFS